MKSREYKPTHGGRPKPVFAVVPYSNPVKRVGFDIIEDTKDIFPLAKKELDNNFKFDKSVKRNEK